MGLVQLDKPVKGHVPYATNIVINMGLVQLAKPV